MAFSWQKHAIRRLYGLDLKNNKVDVKDGKSLGCENVFQNGIGVVSKRRGHGIMFDHENPAGAPIQEIGTTFLGNQKFYFQFSNGKFYYSTSDSGVATELDVGADPSEMIYTVTLDDKLFFVDNVSPLKYVYMLPDQTLAYKVSKLYSRPTVAPTATTGTDYNFAYTVDNGQGESTLWNPADVANIVAGVKAGTVTVQGNTGPQTLKVGDRIRIYARATSTLAQWRNVTPSTGATAYGDYDGEDDPAGGYLEITAAQASYAISTLALSDSQPILYTELGVAINGPAPEGMTGITEHCGRLLAWKGSYVAVAKVSNPNSWPPDSAVKEAFNYGFSVNDGEDISGAKSFQENLYVFKDTRAAVFGGIGPDDSGNNAFTFRRLETNGIGCVAGKSLQVVGDDAQSNYLVWLSQDGFYASTGDKPIRIGEEIETEVQPVVLSNKRKSVSLYHKKDGFYYCFVGSDLNKTGWILDLTQDNGERVGWFKITNVNPTAMCWDESRYLFGTESGYCAFERTDNTSSDFSDVGIETVLSTAVNPADDTITVVNTFQTGDYVTIRTGGTAPGGLNPNVTYYAVANGTKIKFATSQANATAGITIDITSAGVGPHTLVWKKPVSAYYTTNWIKFADAATVKKLAKPMVLLNAAAQRINLTMMMAVDWYDSFFDAHLIEVVSSDSWGLLPWNDFVWGAGAISTPKNVAIARRKVRAVRYKFINNNLDQDFNLKGIEQDYAQIRNRGELID